MTIALTKKIDGRESSQAFGLRWEAVALLSITLLAGALRFYRLGDWSFWRDETYTLQRAVDLANINLNYPLWYMITHWSITPLHMSEWSARLPAAIIGTISVPIIYFLVRRAQTSLIALLAALFITISPWHLFWSQNARFYILLSLLTTAALVVFYLGLEENRLSYLISSLLLVGLGVLTHPTALFVVGVIGAYILALMVALRPLPIGLNRRNMEVLAILAAVPCLFLLWRAVKEPASWTHFLAWPTNDLLWLPSSLVYYLTVPVLVVGVIGAIPLLLRRDRFTILLTLAAMFAPVAVMVISTFSFTASRHMFVAAVPWLILASRGTVEIIGRLRPHSALLGLGIVLLLAGEMLSEDYLYYRFQNGNRWDYRSAYDMVRDKAKPGDVVVGTSPEMGEFLLPETPVLSMWDVDFDALTAGQRRVWLISDMPMESVEPRYRNRITQRALEVGDFDVHVRARTYTVKVYLFDPSWSPDSRPPDFAFTRPLALPQ
ncbi:MAG: glycosyltransferase family 39 protein [Chloroflexota bacterium]